MHVLIIDPSLTARMDLHDAFKQAGWDTTLCATAAAARKAIEGDRFDIVVLDALLTNANGIDLLQDFKKHPATSAIPVILLSAEAQEVLESGRAADAYVVKPYERADVVEQARQLTAQRRQYGMLADKARILAVDDSPTYLNELAEHLRRDDHEVILARSGQQALALLQETPVDCVLLDLIMPEMSGHEACRHIKSSPAWRDIPVVMLTGREDREATIESFDAGADDYVPKSSEYEVLRARLRAQLRRTQYERENRRIREELYQKEVEIAEARAQRELAETRAALLADLQRKNQELHAAKLAAEKARAVAEEANHTKDNFLAVLSHELRTPLTPVLAGTSLLQKDKSLSESAREHVEIIRRNVELESRLIDDLLDLTRIVRGKVDLDKRRIDLCSVIESALEVCRPDLDARQLHLKLDLGHGPYMVEADASRLRQVFWNLIKNAIKFTPHGGNVGLRCRAEDDRIVVEVYDQGIGIEPGALVHIFDAFAQAERSITRQFGGLGLGLAISKALVEMHGGTIDAHSEGHGKGATFTVRLQRIAGNAGLASMKKDSERLGSSAHPLRVLLVEDHGDTAETMAMLLKIEGHEVQTAGDCATALEILAQQKFDILISDLGLPDRSGLELMQELRSRGDMLPGIALSGYGQESDIQHSRAAGFHTHLVKPVDIQRLLEAIDRVARRE